MTNKELQKKITHLEIELTKVKEIAEAMKKRVDGGGVFQPEDGEEYWFISDAGGTFDSQWVDWVDTRIDEGRYAIGNCYSTRQSAEDAVRVLKLVQKARESQGDFVPDWEDSTQPKYLLSFNSGVIYFTRNWATNAASIFGYWEGKSMCRQFIHENEEELIWFFTEYER